MKKFTKYITSIGILFLIIFITYSIYGRRAHEKYYLKASPTKDAINLKSFIQWRPDTNNIYEVNNKGEVYYLCLDYKFWFENRPPIPLSGPPAYCFDSNFNFVGWTIDIGDSKGSLPQKVWEKNYHWTEMKIEDLNKPN